MRVLGWLTPYDVPVPPSWRNPATMATAVRDAEAALRANPKAAQGPRITIFRAFSRLTDLGKPPSPDVLDALVVGLGIAGKVGRRDEALKVRGADSRGFPSSRIAEKIGRSSRTVRRRKKDTPLKRDWPDAAAVIASVAKLTAIRESASAGEWGRTACLTLYDACLWFANRAESVPDEIWWAVGLAFGLAIGAHGRGRFTDDAVEVLWGAPTPRPDIITDAARLYARAEIADDKPPSNRKLAAELRVRPSVIDRLVKSPEWDRAVWSARILARYNATSVATVTDSSCLVGQEVCPVP